MSALSQATDHATLEACWAIALVVDASRLRPIWCRRQCDLVIAGDPCPNYAAERLSPARASRSGGPTGPRIALALVARARCSGRIAAASGHPVLSGPAPKRRHCEGGGSCAVVTVVGQRVELVTRQVDLDDPAVDVVDPEPAREAAPQRGGRLLPRERRTASRVQEAEAYRLGRLYRAMSTSTLSRPAMLTMCSATRGHAARDHAAQNPRARLTFGPTTSMRVSPPSTGVPDDCSVARTRAFRSLPHTCENGRLRACTRACL